MMIYSQNCNFFFLVTVFLQYCQQEQNKITEIETGKQLRKVYGSKGDGGGGAKTLARMMKLGKHMEFAVEILVFDKKKWVELRRQLKS